MKVDPRVFFFWLNARPRGASTLNTAVLHCRRLWCFVSRWQSICWISPSSMRFSRLLGVVGDGLIEIGDWLIPISFWSLSVNKLWRKNARRCHCSLQLTRERYCSAHLVTWSVDLELKTVKSHDCGLQGVRTRVGDILDDARMNTCEMSWFGQSDSVPANTRIHPKSPVLDFSFSLKHPKARLQFARSWKATVHLLQWSGN